MTALLTTWSLVQHLYLILQVDIGRLVLFLEGFNGFLHVGHLSDSFEIDID